MTKGQNDVCWATFGPQDWQLSSTPQSFLLGTYNTYCYWRIEYAVPQSDMRGRQFSLFMQKGRSLTLLQGFPNIFMMWPQMNVHKLTGPQHPTHTHIVPSNTL